MILAHLPAGYIAAKLLHKHFQANCACWKYFLAVALIGSIAPDLDLLYFMVDANRPYHHHAYWSHFPIVWGSLLLIAGIWYRLAEKKKMAALAVMFTLCGFIHICLDSVAGSIRWAYPFNTLPYSLITVPRVTGSRRLDYLVHWSSWLELIPIMWAAILWRATPSPACGGRETKR